MPHVYMLQANHGYEEGGSELIGLFASLDAATKERNSCLSNPQFGFSIIKVEVKDMGD